MIGHLESVMFIAQIHRINIKIRQMCISNIIPLYKNKGDICNPDNYRGISIVSCLGKLFT